MKALLCLSLLCAVALHADETQDRAAINQAIRNLNDPAQRAAVILKDADIEIDLDRLIELHRRWTTLIGMNEPWTQMTTPNLVSGKIRFITPDVATVDGGSMIDGAVTMTKLAPLLFILKKEDGRWWISAIRILKG